MAEAKPMRWTMRKEGDNAYGIVWSLENIEKRTDGTECCQQDLEFDNGSILTVNYCFGTRVDAFPHVKIVIKEWKTSGVGIKISTYSSIGDTFEFLYYTEEEKSRSFPLSYSLPTKLELSFDTFNKNQDELKHPLSLISPSSYPDFHLRIDTISGGSGGSKSTCTTTPNTEHVQGGVQGSVQGNLIGGSAAGLDHRLIPCHRAILAAGSSFFTTKLSTTVPGHTINTNETRNSKNVCVIDRLSSDFESDARVVECAIMMLYHVPDKPSADFDSIPHVSSTTKMFQNLTPDEKLRLVLFADKYFLRNVLRFAVSQITSTGFKQMNLYKVWLTMNSLGDANCKSELQGEIQYWVSRSPHRFFNDLASTLPSTTASLE